MADGKTIPKATLESVGTIKVQLGDMVEVGGGPKGTRIVVDVVSAEMNSDKIKASLATNDAADFGFYGICRWFNWVFGRSVDTKTDDGQFVYVEYQDVRIWGRTNSNCPNLSNWI